MDIKIFDGNLYSYNMLLIEEKTNEALMDRICYMLKYDINNYQKQILFNAIEEIKIINKITKSA
ncbi:MULTISPECIES: hypothetical protein [Clostridium]|uniref:hypothetical protein n=1 Tax=Clostridium TaxID=1485 RepID=UPI00292D7385|nr:hypothetical protein [Clostridium sp.]